MAPQLDATLESVLEELDDAEAAKPASVNFYAIDFESKDKLVEFINDYNASAHEEDKLKYADMMGILMSSVTTIINAITYVLIAFVSISLIVSSIMIGVITLISVQERTKEIGILRAIGASKRNVSSMFNAETMIIGFASGLLGVVVTYLLCIPINLILNALTGIEMLQAILPVPAAIILVSISVLLTLISGIIPSRSAAKKDPVVALRTE
jgi:putative ABC transport system permease protein